ncbi:MAG: glycosyltransferase family 2 protein [Tepidibacter sp.]|jgi:GT2 family glycosyltransferase|uniref:glycosyltransferase family 2 protein n=1 Tax=Tepidibacter sp. TaxID=2529387 RepID=UPI0025E2B805|nr:glycosyltransferase family 2 protein [Tepidibacter sp.]MCT4508405.1 glycosyltransferase family 2 protein [Tepidibacter sp.]
MKTSIIILTYNNLYYSKLCIKSIREYTKKGTYEIIVVDNNSTDGTVEWLKNQDDLEVIFNNENKGFPKGCNQGIDIAKGDNILLLNNDVVVTYNWLGNLIKCLYSADDIGAVGAITNFCTNHQSIPVKYENLDQMSEFAKEFNISNDKKWEERIRLIGFCFLVKKKVVEQVGLLDEIFTPGTNEDNDYSLRIRKEGYRLMLCNDTFIHHFGSMSFKKDMKKTKNILRDNTIKFRNKWGIDASYFRVLRKDITAIIKKSKKRDLNILHIGCGAGATLCDIKNEIPESNLYGIEENKKAVVNTQHFAKIDIGNEGIIKKYTKDFFDYIIITNHNKNIKYSPNIVQRVNYYLKDSGYCILAFENQNIKVLNKQKSLRGVYCD